MLVELTSHIMKPIIPKGYTLGSPAATDNNDCEDETLLVLIAYSVNSCCKRVGAPYSQHDQRLSHGHPGILLLCHCKHQGKASSGLNYEGGSSVTLMISDVCMSRAAVQEVEKETHLRRPS
jgi:hypothetical protein